MDKNLKLIFIGILLNQPFQKKDEIGKEKIRLVKEILNKKNIELVIEQKEINELDAQVSIYSKGIFKKYLSFPKTYFFFKEHFFLLILKPENMYHPTIVILNLENKVNFLNYPHILWYDDTIGDVCCVNKEKYIFDNLSFDEIIDFYIRNFCNLFSLTDEQITKELQEDFIYFWEKNSKNKIKETLILDSEIAKEIVIIEKKEAHTTERIFKEKEDCINFPTLRKVQKKEGLFIPLINSFQIRPFIKDFNLTDILKNNISSKTFDFLSTYICKKKILFIIFKMNLKDNFPIQFILKIEFKDKSNLNFIEKINTKNDEGKDFKITPYSATRRDITYLMARSGQPYSLLEKNIAVIGAGSLGSYLIRELPTIGIKKISIFDDDDLEFGNIIRHSLGKNSIDKKKVFSIKKEEEEKKQSLSITAIPQKITMQNIEKMKLDSYDMVIITVGSSDIQLCLNKYFKQINFLKPVLYTYLEPLGVGCHSLLINYQKVGCFNCLQNTLEKTQFYGDYFEGINHGEGCMGSFNPYGTSILLKGIAQNLKIISDYFSGKTYIKNPLFSVKNYYEKNISYTKNYLKDETFLFGYYDYQKEDCKICGEKI